MTNRFIFSLEKRGCHSLTALDFPKFWRHPFDCLQKKALPSPELNSCHQPPTTKETVFWKISRKPRHSECLRINSFNKSSVRSFFSFFCCLPPLLLLLLYPFLYIYLSFNFKVVLFDGYSLPRKVWQRSQRHFKQVDWLESRDPKLVE